MCIATRRMYNNTIYIYMYISTCFVYALCMVCVWCACACVCACGFVRVVAGLLGGWVAGWLGAWVSCGARVYVCVCAGVMCVRVFCQSVTQSV